MADPVSATHLESFTVGIENPTTVGGKRSWGRVASSDEVSIVGLGDGQRPDSRKEEPQAEQHVMQHRKCKN